MKLVIRFSLPIIGLFALSACSDDGNRDLNDWVDQVKALPATGIEPLPEIRPYEAFIYSFT